VVKTFLRIKEKTMKYFIKSIGIITAILLLASAPYAWCGDLQTNMMGGGGNTTTTMMGGGMTTTIPGGSGNTITTISRGGMMWGGGGMMNQLKAADLNDDNIPEIVTISNGAYLVILDNEGNVLSSKLLPPIPAQTFQIAPRASGLDVADLDGDDVPEIITEYRGYYATYLVILDNQGNLKSYKQIQYTPY
jgi:hypothetical protein